MLAEIDFTAGGWWRAEAYEVRDGYLRPVESALFTHYDPMQEYAKARAQKKGHQNAPERAYVSLTRTVFSLRWKVGPHGQELTEDSKKRLLKWVGDHGLLGILPQETMQLVGDFYRRDEEPDAPLARKALAWDRRGVPEIGLVPQDVTYECGRLDAVTQALFEDRIQMKPWTEVAGPFFPGFENGWRRYVYPSPDDPDFWPNYCEPLDSFLKTAGRLASVLGKMADLRTYAGAAEADPESEFDAVDYVKTEFDPMDWLVSTISLRLLPDLTSAEPLARSQAPSLLAMLAFQLYQDLAQHEEDKKREKGKRDLIRRCGWKQCGTPFVSTGYQALYCSTECRQAAIRDRRRESSNARRR